MNTVRTQAGLRAFYPPNGSYSWYTLTASLIYITDYLIGDDDSKQ